MQRVAEDSYQGTRRRMDEKLRLRPYEDADEEAVVAIWNKVFSDPAPWNDPHSVITKKLATQRDLFSLSR
jgi:hypothetical protein